MRWCSIRRLALLALAVTLAGCGGGGGHGFGVPAADLETATPAPPQQPSAPVPVPVPVPVPEPAPTPPADARNGDYPLFGLDGIASLLKLDFDRQTWRMTGSDAFGRPSDQGGALRAAGSEFEFRTPDGSALLGHFTLRSETALGTFLFQGLGYPAAFIAPRVFVSSLAEAAGSYVVFEAARAAGHRPPEGYVTTATLQDGWLAAGILPSGSDCGATGGPVTANGPEFTWTLCGVKQPFRVAKIGNEKVFLFAGRVALASLPVMMAGVPVSAAFAPGNSRVTFTGDGLDERWADVSVAADSVHMAVTRKDGPTTVSDGSFRQLLLAQPPVRWYDTPTAVAPAFGLPTQPWTYALRTPDITLMVTDLRLNAGSSMAIGLPQP